MNNHNDNIRRRFRNAERLVCHAFCIAVLALGLAGIAGAASTDAERAGQLLQRAKSAEDVDASIRLLRGSVELNPRFSAWYYLGRAYQQKKEYEDAQHAFRKAWGLAPDGKATALAMARAGETTMDAGDLPDGLMLVRDAIGRYPQSEQTPDWMNELLRRGDIAYSKRIQSSRSIYLALSEDGFSRAFGVVQRRIPLHINFATNRHEVDSTVDGLLQVQELTKAVGDLGPIDQQYMLVGHTDTQGGDAYNLGLSQRRAESVRAHIAARVPTVASRLCAVGKGEGQPLQQGNSEEIHRVNRRVEIAIVDSCD